MTMENAIGVRNPRRPRAIGYIRADISGDHQPHHAHDIRPLARRQGYNLVYLVRLWQNSVPNPMDHVLGIVRCIDATALIVPELAHVDNRPEPVCDTCHLITVSPEQFWAKIGSRPGGSAPEQRWFPDQHSDPGRWLSIGDAHRIMQMHKECRALNCPRKATALTRLVEAGRLVPARLSPRKRAAERGIPFPRLEPDGMMTTESPIVLRRLLDGLGRI
ncbi:hypothetical protein [Nocardia brevicatena]|uniref:hypothetical protein n=1 Tax=Nocardia brevicatena TaxID=37327 RepID=UPI0002ED29B8|nr:hypothetical protein [Nocardia brevicatena]